MFVTTIFLHTPELSTVYPQGTHTTYWETMTQTNGAVYQKQNGRVNFIPPLSMNSTYVECSLKTSASFCYHAHFIVHTVFCITCGYKETSITQEKKIHDFFSKNWFKDFLVQTRLIVLFVH